MITQIIKKDYAEYKKLIDDELKRMFVRVKDTKIPKTLYDAMKYSIFNGGKRIRPVLCIATYEAVLQGSHPIGNWKLEIGNLKKILPFACGLEFIHTFSLIQDDLPSMDNDDFRRGKPSLHKVYNEAVAMLTADVLFAKAFELFAQAQVTDKIKVKAISELADICGINGLAAGQMMDILYQNKKLKVKRQKTIDEKKTAKLIAGSMKIGAIVAGANDKAVKKIEKGGLYLGLLFQVTDDMIDRNQKSTLKYALHLPASPNRGETSGRELKAQKYSETAKKIFTVLGHNFSQFIDFNNYILNRKI